MLRNTVTIPTRDVRLDARELELIADALRRRRRELQRSVERAQASRAAGNPVQLGTLDSHMRALQDLDLTQRMIDHNLTALRRQG